MSKSEVSPMQTMQQLFQGKSPSETKALLATLERGGASIYRTLAASESNARAREMLTAAADREDQNAKLMTLMTAPKPECEKCHAKLPHEAEAYSCSFQCTFCPTCTEQYHRVCPNCGGTL